MKNIFPLSAVAEIQQMGSLPVQIELQKTFLLPNSTLCTRSYILGDKWLYLREAIDSIMKYSNVHIKKQNGKKCIVCCQAAT